MIDRAADPRLSTVDRALHCGRVLLNPSPSAALDSRLLLAHVLDVPLTALFAHGDRRLSPGESDQFGALLHRRALGEPVAYLRGFRDWLDLRLVVSPAVLVPRPETELVAAQTIAVARSVHARLIADVGTGSGAIAVALARALPTACILATDVSGAALEVAARNVNAYDLATRVMLRQGSLLTPIYERPDVIVANLPYLSDSMMSALDADVRHEPVTALAGGGCGLDLYVAMFRQMHARRWRVPTIIEIDPRQADAIRPLIESHIGPGQIDIRPDLAGHDRIVCFRPEYP